MNGSTLGGALVGVVAAQWAADVGEVRRVASTGLKVLKTINEEESWWGRGAVCNRRKGRVGKKIRRVVRRDGGVVASGLRRTRGLTLLHLGTEGRSRYIGGISNS